MDVAINIIKSMKLDTRLEKMLCEIMRIYKEVPESDERMVLWYKIIEMVSKIVLDGSSFLLDPEEGEVTKMLYQIKEDYCID